MTTHNLSHYMAGRDNNLNLIRFIAAVLVLIAHSYTLVLGDSAYEPLAKYVNKSIGSIAVDVFFIISGLLITASVTYRPQLGAFVAARVLRIFPALIMANLFCVFFVGILFTTEALQNYLFNTETVEFLFKNTTLLLGIAYDLPGVFVDLPFSGAINGSLWTLPHELRMYIFIALAYYLCGYLACHLRVNLLRYICPIITLLALVIMLNNNYFPEKIFAEQKWLKLLYMFFLGATLFLWREKIVLRFTVFCACLSILAVGLVYPAAFPPFYFITIAYIVIYIAYVPGGIIRGFNKIGDYSYGMYIFAFPIQQMLIASLENISVVQLILVSFFATLALAVPSWYFIEKPSLAQKKNAVSFFSRFSLSKVP